MIYSHKEDILNMATKANLVALATERGVELPEGSTVAEIRTYLIEAGVNPNEADEVKEVEPVNVQVEEDNEDDLVLVRMVRQNASYHTMGYRFSQEHPYSPVKRKDVDHLVNVDRGFVIATESEVRGFYN